MRPSPSSARGWGLVAVAIAAAGLGLLVGARTPRAAQTASSAIERAYELRATYDRAGYLISLDAVSPRPHERALQAARIRAAHELEWLVPRGRTLRATTASPVFTGWRFVVDPASSVPLAGERWTGRRLVERRVLLTPRTDPSLRRALAVLDERRALSHTATDDRSITMFKTSTAPRALAALASVTALGLGGAGTAQAQSDTPDQGTTPARAATVHHWVIVSTALDGTRGKTEGWQRGANRRVLVGAAPGAGFPGCKPGSPQEWLRTATSMTICGRAITLGHSGVVGRQVANPSEIGGFEQKFIDKGFYVPAGDDVIEGRKVKAYREADRAGAEPEDERKLTLTTVYLDAEDGAFVARRDQVVATGKVQDERVTLDEELTATSASLHHAGVKRRTGGKR